MAFNYGVFDLSRPHFVWHFILGQTDYMVCAIPWNYFVREYEQEGRSITEQELNLTPAEAKRLTARLLENCKPENRNYRYNFLYRNCTTQVRDMVEEVVTGTVQYPDSLPRETARQILHHYTKNHPWAQEGNDLLLGAEVDTILSQRASLFIPASLSRAFDGAFILNAKGEQRKLVRQTSTSLQPPPNLPQGERDFLSFEEGWGETFGLFPILFIFIFILLLEIWTKRFFWLWDVLLLLLQGTTGMLVAFMFFFSQHPAVGSNWQLWLLNPVFLVGIPLVIKAAIRHQRTLWYAFDFAVLALFLLFSPWIPQVFAKITVPLALCLLTRPLSYYIFRSRKKRHGRK